jgi:ribosomal protein S18 acetylase RimI-like enzyme
MLCLSQPDISDMPTTQPPLNDLAHVFSRAFFHDPLFEYFFADPSQRQALAFFTFRFLVAHARHNGQVDTTPQPVDDHNSLNGAAVWLPSSAIEHSVIDMLRFGAVRALFKQGPGAIKRQMVAADAMQAVHHRVLTTPHMYLLLLGIDPSQQGRGLSTPLLQPSLDLFDQQGLPCYLDTHNPNNVSLYQRFGFEVVHEGDIPGTSVQHWAMLRQCKSRA